MLMGILYSFVCEISFPFPITDIFYHAFETPGLTAFPLI